jgi:hypothetical protein
LFRRFEYKEYFYPCGAPKGIRTAFAFFCQEFLSTNRKRPEGQGHRNHLLEASEAWKKLPKVWFKNFFVGSIINLEFDLDIRCEHFENLKINV